MLTYCFIPKKNQKQNIKKIIYIKLHKQNTTKKHIRAFEN